MTLRRAALLAAAVLPFAAVLAYTLAFGVDLPRADEWNQVAGIGRAFAGTLERGDFWIPANVHVAVFPRLVMVPLALLTGWDLRVQMLVSVAFMAAAFLVLASRLAREDAVPAWSIPLASAFIFSLHAVDTWLWACQLHVAIAVFGAVSALCVLTSPGLRLGKALLAAALGIVASWSFLSGFVVWPVGALVLALRPFESGRARAKALVVWIAGALVALGGWFVSARSAAGRDPIDASLGPILRYTARYLGTGLLGRDADPVLLEVSGWAGLVVLVVGGAWVAIRKRSSPAALAVLAVGVFGLATGPMIALGRLFAGIERATATRYASFSSLAWIAILLVPWLAGGRPGRAVRIARGALAALAVTALIVTQRPDFQAGREIAAARTEAAAALRKGEGISDRVLEAAGTQEFLIPILADRLATLRRLRISLFRDASPAELAPPPWRGEIRAAFATGDEDGGTIGTVDAQGGVPGNVAYAFLVHGGVANLEGRSAFDGDGRATIRLATGPRPDPSDQFHVLSLDRDGRIIQSVPSPIR